MLSKKRILWTLAVLALIGTTLVVRHERQQRKEVAAAKAKRDKARKAKQQVVVEDEPDEKPAPPKKVPKATVLSPSTKTHLAEQAFISALRGVFQWRSQQPATPETNSMLLAKLSAISCEDLSPEHKTAWQSLLSLGGFWMIPRRQPTLSSRPKASRLLR
jgi:hypothetical protein